MVRRPERPLFLSIVSYILSLFGGAFVVVLDILLSKTTFQRDNMSANEAEQRAAFAEERKILLER